MWTTCVFIPFIHRWPEFSVGRTWLVRYIIYRRCAYIAIRYNNTVTYMSCNLPPRRPAAASSSLRIGWPAYALHVIHFIRVYKRLFGTQPSKNRPPPRLVAGRSPEKWVTVSPAETGSPRVGEAPRNRITGSHGGGGGCLSVRGRFRGWTVRAQPSAAAAAAIIDPFRCDLVRRRRYTRRTHTNIIILRTA